MFRSDSRRDWKGLVVACSQPCRDNACRHRSSENFRIDVRRIVNVNIIENSIENALCSWFRFGVVLNDTGGGSDSFDVILSGRLCCGHGWLNVILMYGVMGPHDMTFVSR